MYIRVTRTVEDRGVLVRPEELSKQITDRAVDWYQSAFVFGEDAKEYWEANKDSIKGYNGEAHTETLYWDLDCKTDPGKALQATKKLYEYLAGLGLEKSIEVYFSGNKGFHLLLKTQMKHSPLETSAICYNVVKEAGIPLEVFDTSVYNLTRIFRIVNTRHQESGLYKVPVSSEELLELSIDEIRKLAAKPRFEEFDTEASAFNFKTKFAKNVEKVAASVTQLRAVEGGVGQAMSLTDQEFFALCPPGYRRCVYALEQGKIGPSERHAAIIRLAAYYRGQSYSRKHAGRLIFEALEKRPLFYTDISAVDEIECNRDIDEVYGKDWKGGTFTCKSDAFLQSKCDHGDGPCFDDARAKIRNVWSISQLLNRYIAYGEEALVEYPKFGIPWIDERVRLRPKTFTMIAGANGSGKTSLVMELMESLNAQKIFHAFFSLDMSDMAVAEKLGAKYTQYSQRQIEEAFNINTFNSTIVEEVMTVMKENLPYTLFDFTAAATTEYIEQTVMGLKQAYENLQLVIVDYAGKLIGEFDNQYANATANANKANDIAKRTNCHFLYLSQVSRENGDHTDPLRTSRVSKDSGAWEENATTVLTMWRPFGSGLDGADDYVHVYIGKNRSGPLGENVFFWNGKTGQIREMESEMEFEEYRTLCEQNKIEPPRFNPFSHQAREDAEPTDNPRFNKEKSKERFKISSVERSNEPKKELPNSSSNGSGFVKPNLRRT